MNNGVNNNENLNGLAPMAGVKISPVNEGPVNASVQQAQPAPQIVQSVPVITQSTPTTQPVVTPTKVTISTTPPQVTTPEVQKKPKRKINLLPILLLIIVFLIIYIIYLSNNYNGVINNLKYNCTPITSSKEDIELDLNSTLVKDLYSKVVTNIREDIVNHEFNNSMKLYLAYRQIPEKDKYDSNCNLFDINKMEPYTCDESRGFIPKAFKEEKLKIEYKKLFGENTEMPKENIQLNNSCIVGYQYIESRGEYVEGYCNKKSATSFKATKTLQKAVSNRNTIILYEDVKYHANEKQDLPSYLKSGTYKYIFRLDMNYNYVLISKTYIEKY